MWARIVWRLCNLQGGGNSDQKKEMWEQGRDHCLKWQKRQLHLKSVVVFLCLFPTQQEHKWSVLIIWFLIVLWSVTKLVQWSSPDHVTEHALTISDKLSYLLCWSKMIWLFYSRVSVCLEQNVGIWKPLPGISPPIMPLRLSKGTNPLYYMITLTSHNTGSLSLLFFIETWLCFAKPFNYSF